MFQPDLMGEDIGDDPGEEDLEGGLIPNGLEGEPILLQMQYKGIPCIHKVYQNEQFNVWYVLAGLKMLLHKYDRGYLDPYAPEMSYNWS